MRDLVAFSKAWVTTTIWMRCRSWKKKLVFRDLMDMVKRRAECEKLRGWLFPCLFEAFFTLRSTRTLSPR